MPEGLGTTYEMEWGYKLAPEQSRKECWVQALKPTSGPAKQPLLVGIHTHDGIVRFISPLPERNGASWGLIEKMLDLNGDLGNKLGRTRYFTFDNFIKDILDTGKYDDPNRYFDERDEPNMRGAAEFIKDIRSLFFRHCEGLRQ